jgi:hypothetical protein
MVAVSAVICTIVGTFLFTSVFAQIDSKQYFSPDDNSNSTNAVREEIDVVRISIEEALHHWEIGPFRPILQTSASVRM